MSLFTMEMTDEQMKSLSYGFAEWFKEDIGVDRELDYEEDYVEDLFNEYAEYLMNEEEMDDDELMTNMYAVVQYYGQEGYVFQDWYEERTVNSADCVEYEEWKHGQPSADEFICSEKEKCTRADDCKGCYGTDDEEEDDESIIQYRKEIEEGCPEGYKTVWNSHGFRYEEEEKEYCDCGSGKEIGLHLKDWKSYCNECGDKGEWTEYEVESGYMLDEETHGESWTNCFTTEEEAKAEYDRLVRGGVYDFVWLVERDMEGEDCMCSETIEEWEKEKE